MAIFRRKPKTDHPGEPDRLLLPLVADRFSRLAPKWEERQVDAELLRAQLADHCRTADLQPVDPEAFSIWTQDLDAEAWRRLALAVSSLEDAPMRELLGSLLNVRELAEVLETGFIGFAREAELLTMMVLRQSELRCEELARKLAKRLGVGIVGESEEDSARELDRLDYGRLLAEAERAKDQAEERLAYLRERQEEELRRRRPRGKW